MIDFRYASAVLMLALLAAVACSSDSTATPAPAATPAATQSAVGNEGIAPNMLQLPNIADTVERVRPAVVSVVARIITQDRFGRQSVGFGSGTGVIFDESVLVLTNNHVIEGGVEITMTQDDGIQVTAEVIGADRLSDLAVLQLPGDDYPALPLRENGALRAGNSGGPLIDLNGNLVGINTAVLRGTGQGGSISVEGIGFAIDVETARQVAEQLVELGHVRWAWMGVFLADLVPEVAAQVGLPIREGVIIQNTVVDGPSDRAGM